MDETTDRHKQARELRAQGMKWADIGRVLGCNRQYAHWLANSEAPKKRARPVKYRRSREERFWAKVDKNGPGGCWIWTGAISTNGYGQFSVGGDHVPAHRYAYELLVGPIPDGLECDHICRVRACLNPDHIEPVTHRENIRRSPFKNGKTHCNYGHEYTPENTYSPPGRPRRMCRQCHRDQHPRKSDIG